GTGMQSLRPTIRLLLSITLSIGFLFLNGRSQQTSPKPNEQAGGAQPASKGQRPGAQAASKEKSPPKDKTQPADEEGAKADGATPKEENKPNLAELRQRGIELVQQVGEEANFLDDRRKAAIIQAVAADVIWPYREQLARDLFRRAFETAVTHSQETQNDKGQQASQSDRAPRTDVRIEVLKLI